MLTWRLSMTLTKQDTLFLATIWQMPCKLTLPTLMILSLHLPLLFLLIESLSQSGSMMLRMCLQDKFHSQWIAILCEASRLTGQPSGSYNSIKSLISLTLEGSTFMRTPNYTLVKVITQISSVTHNLTLSKLHRLKARMACTWCLNFLLVILNCSTLKSTNIKVISKFWETYITQQAPPTRANSSWITKALVFLTTHTIE